MTLDEAKDQVAKDYGYNDWIYFLKEAQEEHTSGFVVRLTDEAWVMHTELNELIEEIERLKVREGNYLLLQREKDESIKELVEALEELRATIPIRYWPMKMEPLFKKHKSL